jgi:S-layer protein (TIGR01567 family)
MKKYKALLLAVFTILITAATAIASAADNDSSITNICEVVGTNYKWEPNEQYPVIDLFGEKDVPLFTTSGNISNTHVNKLAELIIDSNEPHILKEGEKLDLGHGYALETKQINIYNREAWLEFTKDGQHIADQIVSSINDNNTTWTVALDNVQDESNIIVMRVHVGSIGGFVEDNIVKSSGITIDGIWLTDYENARTLKIGDKIGEFKLEKIASRANLSNQGSLVFENATGSSVTCNVVGTDYKCSSWSNRYPLINLFGEKDVPLLTNNDPIWKCHVDKLAKLVLDSNDKYTLKTDENLDLGHGYSLKVREIDEGYDKAWLEFCKNGQSVDDAIISTDSDDNNWIYFRDNIQGADNIPVLKVHLGDIYGDKNNRIVQIDGLWLIDYENATTLKIGDKIGDFTLEKIVSGTNSSNLGSLVFKKNQAVNFSSPTSEKGTAMLTNKSTGPSFPWNWDFWRFITIKGVEKKEPYSTKTSNATI